MISVGVVWWYIIWCEFSMWVWYGVDDKKYDFDRVVLFVDLVWLKSIDFTGVLRGSEIGFLVVCYMKFPY